jgi:lipid-binding SYLF domain-containing protein
MLFMTPDSFKHLMKDKVKLGVDASAAGGPKGRTAAASTNATMRAEILTYSRSRGAFAGVSLNGAVLKPDNDANEKLYGRKVEVKELVEQGNVTTPEPALKFINAVSQATALK